MSLEQTLTLNDYIDQHGVSHLAELIGEKERTVASWYRKERKPRATAAFKIFINTPVDFNGVYKPFVQDLVGQK